MSHDQDYQPARSFPIPDRLLHSADFQAACAARDWSRIFSLINRRAGGASHAVIAAATGLSTSRVSDIIHGRRGLRGHHVIERVADGLRIPGHMLGINPRPWESPPPEPQRRVVTGVVLPKSGHSEVHDAEADIGLAYQPTLTATLTTVDELGRGDVKRRDLIVRAPFALAALAAPSRDWLVASLEEATGGGSARNGMAQVEAMRKMFAIFQEMDVIQGGGDTARRAVAQYLTGHVLPLIREDHPEEVHKALCEVAAEQTYLAGWMAYDSGQHGLAERYLIQSLRLAQESGNRVLGSHVLAGMSDQATQLGYPDEGLKLARAGRHGLQGLVAPAALTDLYVLEARALARMGRRDECAATLLRAEQTFDLIKPDEEPEWARFIDEAYVMGEIANSLRDLGDARGAEQYALQSVSASRRQGRARRGALSQTVVAVAHTQRGDLEAAVSAAYEALEMASRVPSSGATRCVAALDDLRARLVPHQRNATVRELMDRMHETVTV
ncbi:Transcriptional regulator [Carbonactinospora thermoautotrophica]|uniref:Transcriptional regulator n=2 Tax=Carbonactinospora thermoautotrophica TaxID=1469144 RepID=A0A132MP24_9ACTN|nr:helix-turn-helix transcriptional regulator [Carbonactinospora thermoautotrophica]KWW99161.1 Transcriptional regulator [Carbonactinospora thermoautotrophica]